MLYSIGKYSRALFSVAMLLFFVAAVQAQTRTAINNGIWNDIANWDCTCIPSDTEDVVIGDALTINVSGTVTINSVTVNNLAVFTVNDTLYITGSTTIAGGFNNYGIVHVGGDLTNNGAVSGPGTYCVQGVTTNTQSMLGPMDFCDLTPPATTPFIDNPGTGFIQPNVTFCQNSICDPPVSVKGGEPSTVKFEVSYMSGEIIVASNGENITKLSLELIDLQGRLIWEKEVRTGKSIRVHKELTGIYLYRISESGSVLDQGKLLVN